MKAMLTFDTGETIEADVYFNEDRPIYADSMEEDFKRAYNRNAPPNGHKLNKVKIFRTGSVTMPQELKIQIPQENMRVNMTSRGKIKKIRSNKRSIRI